ncbi:hypothetical protein [Ulvibacter sp. MAR_2010_11]|uniref:hypothetical protein n=1 Tax=Ulvibacter sp. MAR_2010_11 TaxID=1250229 RepID=UPI0012FD3CB5|nr:hypothetical protein [Ulvibacter sp. MAR_2010_11]
MKKTKLNAFTTSTMFVVLICFSTRAQVGTGTKSPNPTPVFDIFSTARGMIAPRMTTAQSTGISTPANSLCVYNSSMKDFITP